MLTKRLVFGLKVFDDGLLVLVDEAGKDDDKKLEMEGHGKGKGLRTAHARRFA